MSLKQQNALSGKRSYCEQAISPFQPKKRIMVLGDNCNPELNPNVKLYLDGKFDDLVTQINTRGSHSGYLEDKLKEFKKELSDMFENQTQDIIKLIKESHKQILETVESKLERPAKDTAKIQPYTTGTQPTTEIQPSATEIQPSATEIQPYITECQLSTKEIQATTEIQSFTTNIQSSTTKIEPSTTKIQPSKKNIRKLRSFPSIGPVVISYLSESNKGWDMACQYTSPQNKKISTAIIDYVLKNPTAEILMHREYSMLDHHQKLDIITNKTKNYFHNLRQKIKSDSLNL